MTESLKTPKPGLPFDSQFVKEESHVRGRGPSTEPAGPPNPATTSSEGQSARTRETVAERTARIDQKLSVAHLLLRKLSPLDPRARLLASAVLRRDEVLLDGVLGQLTEEVFDLVRER